VAKRIVILGGGFGGVYTAQHLTRLLKNAPEYEVVLINRENYFVFQPMLAEIIGGTLAIMDTVSPLRRLVPDATLYVREIEGVNIAEKTVTLAPQFSHKSTTLTFDHLVVALGNVTDFRQAPGLYEHALPFKNLSDSIRIRNHVIDTLEAAATEENPIIRKSLLTYIVAGGGFSGTEIVAEINDLVHKLVKKYPTINPKEIHVVLLHSKTHLMEHELTESLSRYAEQILIKKGVDIRFGIKLTSATPEGAILSTAERILSKTIISTVPSSTNPIVETMGLPLQNGRILTDASMLVPGFSNIWALGDAASVPDINKEGAYCPATAQFAIRQAKTIAANIAAQIKKKPLQKFRFKSLGMLGALGHYNAVAEFFGSIRISGFFAWILWRAIYWMKLPGFDRKIKVATSWLLDTLIPSESVQLKLIPPQGILPLHFEAGEFIFHEGDVGDYLYIIVKGSVEVLKEKDGKEVVLGKLTTGQYFGEMALLNQKQRFASIRCLEAVDIVGIRKNEFGILISHFPQLKSEFEQTDQFRRKAIG
jgi:NADH:ubiquinone reductase (H+-translocating)